ncbi:hypothetical protein [Halalkalibaculum sp. DA3122]|uniref:hypothetical protein n=1 Tax=unclassified Halalkalibaculum TaxID=2964617 RepID=UPI003754F973
MENEQYFFSMYGYLDASADTQWVRIAPARTQLEMPDDIPEMQVTLREMESGRSAVMKDSLFQLDNGVNMLNFWTTMDLKPQHTYRLKAERKDGAYSSVTVTIPPDFPQPRLGYAQMGCSATVSIREVERLADIQSVWQFHINQAGYKRVDLYRFSYRDQAYGLSGGYTVTIDPIREREHINVPDGDARLTERYLWVASGGPEWVEGVDSLDNITYTLPEGFSNVTDGLGYVVGIISKKIPYKECSPQ